MEEKDAIGIYVPAEYYEVFKELVEVGLERMRISQEERANLSSWWSAESQMADEELEARS
jgi:hypothetical protein